MGFNGEQAPFWRRRTLGIRGMIPMRTECLLQGLYALTWAIQAFISGEKDPGALLAHEIRDLKALTEKFNYISDPFHGAFKPPLGLTFQEFHDELVLLLSAVQATPTASNFDKAALEVFCQHLFSARIVMSKCGMQVVIDTVALVECMGIPNVKDACPLNQEAPNWNKGVSAPPADSSEAGVSAVTPKRKPGKAEGNKAKPQPHVSIEYPKWASHVASGEKTREQCHQEYETENLGQKTYRRSSFIAKLSDWMRANPVGDPKGQAP